MHGSAFLRCVRHPVAKLIIFIPYDCDIYTANSEYLSDFVSLGNLSGQDMYKVIRVPHIGLCLWIPLDSASPNTLLPSANG